MRRRPRATRRRTLGDVLQILAIEHPTFLQAVDVLATRELKRIEKCKKLRKQRAH